MNLYKTERPGRVLSTTASYLQDPKFESRPKDRVS